MYTYIILGIIALVVLLSAAHAAMFGLRKAGTRLVVVALSAVGAIGTCLLIKQLLPTPDALTTLVQNNLHLIEKYFGANIVAYVEQGLQFANISPTILELAIQLSTSLILPLLCILLFFIYGAIAWIACSIVLACIRRSEEKKARAARDAGDEIVPRTKGSRLLAASLGLVQGLVIVIMLMIPVSAYLAIAQPTLGELTSQGVLDESDPVISTTQEIVTSINNDHVVTTYRVMGGEMLCDSMLDMNVAGMKIKTTEELGSLLILANHVTELTKTEFANYSEEEAAIIRAIGDSFADSKLLAPIVGDILYAATDAWLNGETFLGIGMPDMGESAEMFEPFIIALLEIIHEDARETILLQADVKTLAEMVAILAQNRIFANMADTDALLDSLTQSNAVNSLITVLGSNNTMKRLIPEAMNLGVRAIGQVLNIPANTEQVYDKFMVDITDTLNDVRDLPEQQRIEQLSEKLGTSFDNAGLDVDEQLLDVYATAMLHDLSDNNPNDVTTADVQAFFALYAQNVAQTTASLSTKPKFELLSDVQAADPYAGTVYEGKTEQDLAQTAAYAIASLCINLASLDAEAEDVTEQAKTLVVDTFTELLGAESAALEVVSRVEIKTPISQSSVDSTASLQSTEAMKEVSKVITLEVLLVDTKEAALKITAESISSDAAAITAIFNTAADLKDVVGNSDEEMDIATLASSVGTILDSLQQTEAFGKDKTASLFTAVLQSETVRDTANLDMKTATQLAEKATEGDVSYSQTMDTIAGSVNIMEKLAADGTITDEEMVELIENLNPQTAGMIVIYVNAERLVENGVPEKHAPITSDLVKSLFTYMEREDLKDYNKEAKALNQILKIALAAKNSEDKALFSSAPGAVDGKLPTAKETVDTLMDSEAVRYALLDVLTDGTQVTLFDPYDLGEKVNENSADYQALRTALTEHRAAHPEIDDLVYEALAALMGVQVDLAQ